MKLYIIFGVNNVNSYISGIFNWIVFGSFGPDGWLIMRLDTHKLKAILFIIVSFSLLLGFGTYMGLFSFTLKAAAGGIIACLLLLKLSMIDD